MARAVAQHLQGVEFGVFARRSVEVGGKATLAWDLAPEAISRFPTVVSTVPGGVSLVPVDAVGRAMAARSEPLLFIDLGMPPGFKRPHADTPVRYLGVDEVASSADDKPSIEVDEKVTRGASALWHRLSAPSRVGAIIAGLIDQADATVSQEVARFSARLQTADDPERILQQLAHTVARRVLHGPISYVSSTERGLDVAEALAEAFGIPDD
jgi:glutamyl-tRNA reductase